MVSRDEQAFTAAAKLDKKKTAREVCLEAERAGFSFIARVRILRSVFGLSLPAAKEVGVTADGEYASLSDYQASLLPALKQALPASKSRTSRQSQRAD